MFRRDIGHYKKQPFPVIVLVVSFWFKEKHRASLLVGGESQKSSNSIQENILENQTFHVI